MEPLSPLQLYLQEVARYPLLSPEEEFELAKQHYEEGSREAAQRLVTANLRLVIKIAFEFKRNQNHLLDLIQEGNTGLLQAVRKFNPYKGVKLSTYAAWWIKAYILKHIIDSKSQVKIGTTAAQRKLFFNLRKETEKLLREYEHIDTKLLAESLDVKEEEVIEMQQRLGSPDVSLDGPLETGESRLSLLPDSTQKSADDELANQQIAEFFHEHVEEFEKSLKDRDLEVFRKRLLQENPLTLQEIGDLYGITRERARQIEARLIKQLKEFVEKKGIIDL